MYIEGTFFSTCSVLAASFLAAALLLLISSPTAVRAFPSSCLEFSILWHMSTKHCSGFNHYQSHIRIINYNSPPLHFSSWRSAFLSDSSHNAYGLSHPSDPASVVTNVTNVTNVNGINVTNVTNVNGIKAQNKQMV